MKNRIIEELIETRVNGNSIKGNKTYEKMLNRISKEDIKSHAKNLHEIGDIQGSKLGMIEQIRDLLAGH